VVPKQEVNHESVDQNQVYRASLAILKLDSKEKPKKKNLLEDPKKIYAVITVAKIPQKKNLNPLWITLPHPYREKTEICVFVKDPIEDYKPMVKDIPGVTKVMAVSKLRANFKQYESRRKLRDTYDMFVCDDAVTLALRSLLGKTFFKSGKIPIPIKFDNKLHERMLRVPNSTFLTVPLGTSMSFCVGTTKQSAKDVSENVMKSLQHLHKRVAWKNIQSLSLRSSSSIGLPFFNQIVQKEVKKKVTESSEDKGK